MIDFVGGFGTIEKIILWSHGYGLAIAILVVCILRNRQNEAAIKALEQRSVDEMAKAQKEFDDTVAALRKQYREELLAIKTTNANELVLVESRPFQAGDGCPYCGQKAVP